MQSRREMLTLGDNTSQNTHLPQSLHGPVRTIRPRLVQIGPSQEAPRPITLPSLMIAYELVVIDGAVCFVQRIRPASTTIVRQARCHRYACTGEQDSLAVSGLDGRTELR